MFSLLNPLGLWFGALLAVPLAIHFLGRQRLDRQPFPSLLLVKEGFARSMQRHRLKNLLLLIIRTLLVACLLLALSNPALESRATASKPDRSLALIHNGIYGGIPGAPAGTRDALETQRARARALDSALGTRTVQIPVIADGPGIAEVSQRFGDFPDAVRRLLADPGPGTALAALPVFDWAALAAARPDLERALKEHAGLQLAFTDYGDLAARAAAFASLRSTPSPDAPTTALSARLSPAAAATGGKARVYLDGRVFHEGPAASGHVEVTLPLGSGPRTEGAIVLDGPFAAPALHFCFPDAGSWSLAHAGGSLASLPSLGRETYFRRVTHVASARDIAWSGEAGGGRPGSSPLRLAYLAAERGAQAEAYGRAVEFVKRGGRLIVAAGRESDIPLLNRFLLQPLRLGRLGNLVDSAAPAAADRQALARMGRASGDPAAAAAGLGMVRKRYAFFPDSGTDVLIAAGGAPVLAGRAFHRGHALVWSTDIDDLEWTDLGVSPLVPLLHQAFQEAAAGERAANRAAAADSFFHAPLPEAAAGTSAVGAEVRDPEGRAFTKARVEGTRLRIGPFDRLGLHRVIAGGDTLAFAVNLLPESPAGAAAGPAEQGWAEANEAAREAFLEAMSPWRARIAVLSPDDPPAAQASVRRLWPAFLLGAILLLFLEGLISTTFSTRRDRARP